MHFTTDACNLELSDGRRRDREWLAAQLEGGEARFVLVAGDRGASVAVRAAQEGGGLLVGELRRGAELPAGLLRGEPIFLGEIEQDGGKVAVFAAEVVQEQLAGEGDGAESGADDVRWVDLRKTCSRGELPQGDASLLALGRQLVVWRRSARFCGSCGAPTRARKGGWAATCTAAGCGVSVYPRLDPCIITFVKSHCEQWVLLGHNVKWEAARFALLAGFVEPGEALEDCVVREVLEETGVRVEPSTVRYTCSQPWPFPQSYMLGFSAKAEAGAGGSGADAEVLPEGCPSLPPTWLAKCSTDGELACSKWFHVDWLREHRAAADSRGARWDARGFHFPGGYSLARRMLEAELASPSAAWTGPPLPFARLAEGKQKWVLLRVTDDNGSVRLTIAGDPRAPYHADILAHEATRLQEAGAASVECLGGAFTELRTEDGTLRVWGDSSRFGPAHEGATAALLQAGYPMFALNIERIPGTVVSGAHAE